jgi:pyruvate/2-oxoglutarate dehydrogenase complex dihydrolipoamide dehydrogenase (E3) component
MPGLTLIKGTGALAGRAQDVQFRVVVGDRVLVAPRIVLNTGTRPFLPPIEGLVVWSSNSRAGCA